MATSYYYDLIKRYARNWFTIDDVTHACAKHLNKSDDFLVSRNKPLSATFITEDHLPKSTLWDFVLELIQREFAEDIADWMEDITDSCQWTIYSDELPNGFQGRVYVASEDRFEKCDGTLVILSKTRSGRKFYISTIFPFSNEHEPEINDIERY